MTKNQEIVMWCGLVILLVYLFTDRNFKNALFGTNTTTASNTTLDSFQSSSGKPASNPWGYPGTVSNPVTPKKTTA
jgi:hypothetical protein